MHFFGFFFHFMKFTYSLIIVVIIITIIWIPIIIRTRWDFPSFSKHKYFDLFSIFLYKIFEGETKTNTSSAAAAADATDRGIGKNPFAEWNARFESGFWIWAVFRICINQCNWWWWWFDGVSVSVRVYSSNTFLPCCVLQKWGYSMLAGFSSESVNVSWLCIANKRRHCAIRMSSFFLFVQCGIETEKRVLFNFFSAKLWDLESFFFIINYKVLCICMCSECIVPMTAIVSLHILPLYYNHHYHNYSNNLHFPQRKKMKRYFCSQMISSSLYPVWFILFLLMLDDKSVVELWINEWWWVFHDIYMHKRRNNGRNW